MVTTCLETCFELRTKQLKKAIVALKEVEKQWQENKDNGKQLLFDDEGSKVFLQLALKKIPVTNKFIKVYLPHPPLKDKEVCLITGDLDKNNPKADCEETVHFYKELLRKHQVTDITEVVSLRELNTDYKQFEAKRRLCHAYDVFLADKKIAGCLPRVLGKVFIKSGKLPMQIDMKAKNLKKEITNAVYNVVCSIKERGPSSSVLVGNINQSKQELVENIKSAISKVSSLLPGGWKNIHSLHIKCSKSLSIPIYVSLESPNVVQIPSYASDDPVEDELSTLPKSKVRVFPSGEVEVLAISEEDDDDGTDMEEFEKEILKMEQQNAIGKAEKLASENEFLRRLKKKSNKRKRSENRIEITKFKISDDVEKPRKKKTKKCNDQVEIPMKKSQTKGKLKKKLPNILNKIPTEGKMKKPQKIVKNLQIEENRKKKPSDILKKIKKEKLKKEQKRIALRANLPFIKITKTNKRIPLRANLPSNKTTKANRRK